MFKVLALATIKKKARGYFKTVSGTTVDTFDVFHA